MLSELCELFTPGSFPLSLFLMSCILASSCDSSALLAHPASTEPTWGWPWAGSGKVCTLSSFCSPSLRTNMKSSCSSCFDPLFPLSSEWHVLNQPIKTTIFLEILAPRFLLNLRVSEVDLLHQLCVDCFGESEPLRFLLRSGPWWSVQ